MHEEQQVAVYELFRDGKERLDAGNPAGAVEVLELAVEAEPHKGSLRETLARAYFASQRTSRARDEFERVLELDPKDDYAHFGLGRCLERQGELARAKGQYKLARALSDLPMYERALRRVEARLA